MAVVTDPSPQEQLIELNQQLLLMTEQLADFKEMLYETKVANKSIELQLNQAKQQISKQITEECQAVRLRSGKTLSNTAQKSKKPNKEQLTEDNQTTVQNPSEDSKSPERNVIGVQTPEREGKLALNAHSLQFWRSNARKGGKVGVKRPISTQSWRSNAKGGLDT